MYAAGVLLPCCVNDLDRLPLAEVASGAHDPEDLRPGDAWGGAAGGGLLSLALLPIAAFRGVGVSVAVLVLLSSATGEALTVWRLD